jgi:hypothetical protein
VAAMTVTFAGVDSASQRLERFMFTGGGS